ncbi:MAG: hypothetical protein JXA78_14055 [Anaerolineales bacterium]|nr:hypothetical protein [Anaerolineales bacterium]
MNVVNHDTLTKNGLAISIEEPDNQYGMSHLINAALVDQEFCRLLLTNPTDALAQGCYGEMFNLPNKERQFVLTTRASSLTDFAERWIRFANP